MMLNEPRMYGEDEMVQDNFNILLLFLASLVLPSVVTTSHMWLLAPEVYVVKFILFIHSFV